MMDVSPKSDQKHPSWLDLLSRSPVRNKPPLGSPSELVGPPDKPLSSNAHPISLNGRTSARSSSRKAPLNSQTPRPRRAATVSIGYACCRKRTHKAAGGGNPSAAFLF